MICIGYICDKCIHKHDEKYDGWRVACDAFPKGGIPESILYYGNEDTITECANGIGFAEDPEKAKLYDFSK